MMEIKEKMVLEKQDNSSPERMLTAHFKPEKINQET
jgi:hypothetical protein